jgi:hypothetical protein
MAKPSGPEYVEAALERMQSASEAIGELEVLEEGWKPETLERLASTASLLRGTMDRFFLKTRVCLPFARKCEGAARELDTLLTELDGQPASDAQGQLAAALEALEKAARTLDERSMMQGMAIT